MRDTTSTKVEKKDPNYQWWCNGCYKFRQELEDKSPLSHLKN